MDTDEPGVPAAAAAALEDAGAAGDGDADASAPGAIILADPRQESSREYSVRLGRWRRDARTAMDCAVFRTLTRIYLQAHSPMEHHQHFVEKKLSKDERHSAGCKASQLSTGKAIEIQNGFSDKLVHTDWQTMLADVSPSWREELYVLIAELAMNLSASYSRRSGVERCMRKCTKKNRCRD